MEKLAEYLGFTGEAQVIHYALRKLAKEVLPAYEADDGELMPTQLVAIRKAIPQVCAKSVNRACSEAWGEHWWPAPKRPTSL